MLFNTQPIYKENEDMLVVIAKRIHYGYMPRERERERERHGDTGFRIRSKLLRFSTSQLIPFMMNGLSLGESIVVNRGIRNESEFLFKFLMTFL